MLCSGQSCNYRAHLRDLCLNLAAIQFALTKAVHLCQEPSPVLNLSQDYKQEIGRDSKQVVPCRDAWEVSLIQCNQWRP